MVWTVTTDKYHKEKAIELAQRSPGSQTWKKVLLPGLITAFGFIVAYYYFFYRTINGEMHAVVRFDDKYEEICRDPKLPIPQYKGPESFFNYIMNPETDYCYSWIQFGGEKQPIPAQNDESCNDEIRKEKFICFNDEYKANHDPCLVYSFGKDLDDQFERDMHLYSCETHVFDHDKVTKGEHLRRSEFWNEHSWDISEYPYDISAAETKDGRVKLRRSMDYITTMLQHKGKEIKYLKSDLEGREWILLKQIITYNDFADFRQIGMRLHLPISVNKMDAVKRNKTLEEYFKILQSMSCAGYRYVLSRPVKYYKGGLRFPEVNRTLFPAYEVNFVKDLNI